MIGSISAMRWARHARLQDGRPPLTTLGELEVSLIGAIAAATVVALLGWLWRRWRGTPAA